MQWLPFTQTHKKHNTMEFVSKKEGKLTVFKYSKNTNDCLFTVWWSKIENKSTNEYEQWDIFIETLYLNFRIEPAQGR